MPHRSGGGPTGNRSSCPDLSKRSEWNQTHLKELRVKSDPLKTQIVSVFMSSLASSIFFDVFVKVTQVFFESTCTCTHHSWSSWYILIRGGICHSRHSRRECKIFASSVNFSTNNAVCYINESKKLHFILISSLNCWHTTN